jgi:GNAT superfamily N-acetyltransferase
MRIHEPTGSLLAILSVTYRYRKQGIATRMLQADVQMIATVAVEPEDHRPAATIVLLSNAYLLAFYVKCGFQVM